MKYFFLLVFISIFGFWGYQEDETLEWSPTYKLAWADFKGEAPDHPRAAAITASGITYQFSTLGTGKELELDFKATTYFYPDKSWYQSELCDSLILSHEQLHFDISELFARKMRKRIDSTKFTQNVKAEVRSIYKEILKELNEFQNLYDEQTNFSRDIEQQLIWNKKIVEALKN